MSNQKTLILIDGHALAFRQYYALERTNMRNTDGIPTWAVYGFFKAIFDLLKKQKPDAICVAFDVSHHTFRVDKYSEYKANRQAMPDNMSCQMQYIYDGLKAFNIPIYTKEGFEADDVIGTIAKHACQLNHKVLILTGDQDSFQLIDKDGCTKVIIPSKGELIEYDWEKVYEKLGVYPDQVVDYKSLRGDTSDNIPGIKGIGEKTAVKLLAQYGHLQNIIDNCDKIEGESVRTKFCQDIEMAKLSYELATIVKDVDINFDFEGTKIELPNLSDVTAFLKQMQFYTFLKNIDSILATFNLNCEDIPDTVSPQTTTTEDNQQLGLFSQAVKTEVNQQHYDYESQLVTDDNSLNEMIETLKNKSVIAFKSEFTSKNAVENTLSQITLSYNESFSVDSQIKISDTNNKYSVFIIPVNNSKLSFEKISSALKQIFENENIKKITYDYKSERNLWKANGIKLKGVLFDVMLASYVKDMSKNHSLNAQALENINHITNDAVNINAFDDESVKNYASDIIITIFELTKYWIKNLDDRELKLLYQMEVPMSEVLSDMEFAGVSLDSNYLLELSKDMENKLTDIQAKIYELAGEDFNISSPKQVGYILFEKLQLEGKKKRSKNKFSTSAEVLEELAQDNEIVQLILEYRKYSKLKSTYTDSLPSLISSVDERIHTTYNQTQTATGRLSSSNPNLQNIPVRSQYGNKIRQAFAPKDRNNGLILSADYSQIELRLLAHISGDENLIDAFKSKEDVHTLTASKIFAIPLNEVTKQMRYKAKAVNFGIVYGQSKYGLAKSLGISADEAQDFINKYFNTYPKIKQYMEMQAVLAQKNGYVETLFGRKRHLVNEFLSPNAMIREFAKRAAINYPMQGSASDLIKIAMIDFASKLSQNNLKSKLIMQVHDELVVEVIKDELEQVKELVKNSMELNQPLSIPLVVDINVGETWLES